MTSLFASSCIVGAGSIFLNSNLLSFSDFCGTRVRSGVSLLASVLVRFESIVVSARVSLIDVLIEARSVVIVAIVVWMLVMIFVSIVISVVFVSFFFGND